MRKVAFFAAFAFLIFSSFAPTNHETGTLALKNLKPTGASWKVDETTVLTDVTFFLCNGDEIHFPELVVHEDLHGVENGKISLVQGKVSFTGTAISVNTGEVYTLNDEERLVNKFPIVNGATVIHDKYVGILTGDQGSKDNFITKFQIAINAKGEITGEHFSFSGVECQ